MGVLSFGPGLLSALAVVTIGCGAITQSADAGLADAAPGSSDGPMSASDGAFPLPLIDAGIVDSGPPDALPEPTCIMIDIRPLRCTEGAVADYCGSCLGLTQVNSFQCSEENDPRSSCAQPTSCGSCSVFGSSGSFQCVTSVDCQ